jgi:DNA-binding NarL/FixJ family response regulator
MKTHDKPTSDTTRKRILIVEDHPLTRLGLSQLLSREPGLTVCGETGDAREVPAALLHSRPDLVLTDLTMPGKSGLEFIQDLRQSHPQLPLLVVSMHDEAIYAERALRAGARGYIMKSEGGDNLLAAVRQVLAGEIYLSKKMSGLLLSQIVGQRSNPVEAAIGSLTEREFAVFQLMGQGLITKEIGHRLHISGKTVETHRGHIKKKLKLPNTASLASYAVRWAVSKQLT